MLGDQPDIGDYRWSTYGFWFDGPTPSFKTAAEAEEVESTFDEDGVSNFDGDNYRWFFDSEDYPREGGEDTLSSDADFAKWGFTQSPVDRGQVWAMKSAQDYADANGDEIKFVTAMWSPALWLKEAGSHTYDGRVAPEMYEELADYVADMVQGYEKVYGIPLYGFSLSNEPNHSGNYSSSYWDAGTYADILKIIGAEFVERGITTKLQGVEPMSYNLNIFTGGAASGEGRGTGVFRDPDALQYLDDQAFHSYGWNRAQGGTVLAESKARAQQNDQQIWLTEISLMSSQANTMTTGVAWAQYWGRQLGIAEMSATGHWWAFGYKKLSNSSAGTTRTVSAENLIYLVNSTSGNNNTGVISGEFTGDYEISRTAYALGHYSKFVRPGWKRVNHDQRDFASGADTGSGNPSDLVTTAFINPEANADGSHDFAIVAANGATEQTVSLAFPGYNVTGAQQYLTDAEVNVVDDAPTAVDLAQPLTIAANSIYTFTGKVSKDDSYHVDATSVIPAHTYADVMGAYTNKGISLENSYLQTYDIPGATTATSGNTEATVTYANLDFGAGLNSLELTCSNASANGSIPVAVYLDQQDADHLVSDPAAAIAVSTSATAETALVALTEPISGVHDVILVLGAEGSAVTARVQSLSFDAVTYQLTVAAGEGGEVAGSQSGAYMPGETIALTASAAEGYQWIGWTAPALGYLGARTNPLTFAMPSADVEITASFRQPIDGLKDTYADSFLVGNVYSSPTDFTNETRQALLTEHFNVLTAENYMKPNQLCSAISAAGVLTCANFARADALVATAQANDMAVHGHVLVWHDQTPSSFYSGATGGTRELAKRNMEIYIKTVAEHFDGQLISWDVVNEAFQDSVASFDPATQDWRTVLRGASSGTSGWLTAYRSGANAEAGEKDGDHIYDAFVLARKYDPDVKLYYNDFNLFESGKVNAVIAMATEFNAKYAAEHPEDPRQLIEGIGMQAHNYIAQTPAFAPAGQTAFGDLVEAGAPAGEASVEASIIKLIDAGFDISASELDLFVFQNWDSQPQGANNNNANVYRDLVDPTASELYYRTGEVYWVGKIANRAELEQIQAQRYAEYFAVYKRYASSIDRITFWGLRDYDSWRRNHNPLLWNQDYSEKLAAVAVSDPEAWLGLEGAITDSGALAAAVAAAQVLEQADHKAANWDAFASALSQAQTVLAAEAPSQAAINQALTALNSARAGLALAAEVQLTVSQKCLAGKVYLTTAVKNIGTVSIDVSVTSPVTGAKEYLAVAPGKANSVSLNTKATSVAAGAVSYSAGVAGRARLADGATVYSAFSCG
ncbi:MAG: endo-1,4-beta-xylanase, partial [Bifidobacteriaceae bacterium]|jgi:endo-1,4-beta-xylanase|nr:endo-1,4-beta-xylanase [Bifidobacteriaceae bacterium]